MDNTQRYSFLLRHLHWIGGLVFLAALVAGLVMDEMARGAGKAEVMFFHKSLGLAVAGLAVLRLVEWVRSSQPGALDSHAIWERRLSLATKIGLYAVMFALPLSGVLMSWLKGYGVSFFGLFELAPLFDKNHDLAEVFEEIHESIVPVVFVLLGLHIAGALKHHFMDKDETVQRISPVALSKK